MLLRQFDGLPVHIRSGGEIVQIAHAGLRAQGSDLGLEVTIRNLHRKAPRGREGAAPGESGQGQGLGGAA